MNDYGNTFGLPAEQEPLRSRQTTPERPMQPRAGRQPGRVGAHLLDLLSETADWHSRGNCLGADPDLFFPERGASCEPAKAICRPCAVRSECLEYALAGNEKYGIWGATSERERRRIRRDRAALRKAEQWRRGVA